MRILRKSLYFGSPSFCLLILIILVTSCNLHKTSLPTSNLNPTQSIVAPIGAPEANFTAEPGSGFVPLTVEFTSTSTGNITNYLWDFGDGDTSDEISPEHTYTKEGNYRPRLTVFGPYGSDFAITDIVARKERPVSAVTLALTIDNTRIDETLIDFPILLYLSQSSGLNSANITAIFDELPYNDRKKIVITDAQGIYLYTEIEEWTNERKEAWLWVKVPEISASIPTILYIIADHTQPNNPYVGDIGESPARNVWDDGFAAVYHMNDYGELVRDSTNNQIHGQKVGGSPDPEIGGDREVTTPCQPLDPAKNRTGPSAVFKGENYIILPGDDSFSPVMTGHLIVSCWFSPSVLNMNLPPQTNPGNRKDGQCGIIDKTGKGPGDAEWRLNYYGDSYPRNQGVAYYTFNPSGGIGTGHYMFPYSETICNDIATGQWEQLIGRTDDAAAIVHGSLHEHWVATYKNGLPRNGQDLNSTVYTELTNTGSNVRIGGTDYNDGNYNFVSRLIGRVDEARIENAPRSDAWIKANYFSQVDQLISYVSNSN